jgi:DNA invertase Pin-like site-specific DNA recombinase
VAEMPYATEFQLHIFAALAQEERRLISERTKAALAQAKKRGVRLGQNGRKLAELRKAAAFERSKSIEAQLPTHWQYFSLNQLARLLDNSAIKPLNGGYWSAEQVKRTLMQLGAF